MISKTITKITTPLQVAIGRAPTIYTKSAH